MHASHKTIMYLILWEYQVSPNKQSEFGMIYSPTGTWAELFKRGTGYVGSELLRDESRPNRYFIIDRWLTKKDYETFMLHHEDEYKALSEEYKDLVETESLVGKWITIDR